MFARFWRNHEEELAFIEMETTGRHVWRRNQALVFGRVNL